LLLIVAVALLAPIGCQNDEIETHRVPYQEPPPPPEAKVRLLGAIIPHEKDVWFFKLSGPLDAVEKQKPAFDDLIQSVRFTDQADEPITWKAPEGSERVPGAAERYATIRLGPKDAPLDLTVHKFPKEGEMGSDLANVNRWRGQVGLAPVRKSELGELVQKAEVAGSTVSLVDMRGPGPRDKGKGPPANRGMGGHPPTEKLRYTAPEGWKETDPVVVRNGMEFRYEAALKVEEGGASALLTVSKLAGTGGGLLQNVNRWRSQIGLSPLDKEQLIDAAKDMKVGGAQGLAVDFTGPGIPPGKEKRRVLGVVVPREGLTWFIKMDGPADLVGKQEAAFQKFVGSVTFDGGKGG
jgi:hypothetical protein